VNMHTSCEYVPASGWEDGRGGGGVEPVFSELIKVKITNKVQLSFVVFPYFILQIEHIPEIRHVVFIESHSRFIINLMLGC
jgi:hypothetical protein